MTDAFLADTNVLLRFVKHDDRDYDLVWGSVARLRMAGAEVYYTTQNLAEFWNTCTRPARYNGFVLSVSETDSRAEFVEAHFTLLIEDYRAVHYE